MQVIKIEANTQLSWRYTRDANGDFIAVCDPLGLAVSGETFDELLDCIQDALTLLMIDLFQRNELKSFLKQRGWRLMTPMLQAQAQAKPRNLRFDVPFAVTPERERGAEAFVRS